MAGSQRRKQPKLQKVCNNIPSDDVIFNNILIRLPSKQVARLRCVSKVWNAVLSQPSFIKSHLHHSIQAIKKHNSEFLLLFHDRFSFDKPFTAYSCTHPHNEYQGLIKSPVNASSYVQGGSYVIGAINGLICFGNYTSSTSTHVVIHLWNPSLSALLALPPYTFITPCDFEILFRFGFDPKTDDYKVVKLAFRTGTVSNKWLHVEVYSMRKSSWKLMNQTPPSHIIMSCNINEHYVNEYDGYVHWFGFVDNQSLRQAIVSFDLGSETFSEISLSNSIANSCNTIGVLQGKLCVMSSSNIIDNHYEVWVMNEYGVAESWVQNHVFSRFNTGSSMIIPFGFTLNNLFILEAEDEHLALYDPLEPKVNYLNVSIMRRYRAKIVQYVDSLVWVSPAAKRGSTVNIY